MEKLERKLVGIQRAKSILMTSNGLTEDAAYQVIRKQAMSKRVSMEEMDWRARFGGRSDFSPTT